MKSNKHIVWSDGYIETSKFEERNGHKSGVVWLTGLSGSGKSTLAKALQQRLFEKKKMAYVLDGDNIRHRLNGDLGFSEEDRRENIRRISEVAVLFQKAGFIVITAFISPYREDRDKARSIISPAPFIEVFLDTDLETCQNRDPKGLYKKAMNGEITEFTGVSSPYEVPLSPEIRLSTAKETIEQSTEKIIEYLEKNNWFNG